MTEKERLKSSIDDFVKGDMDWESALDLIMKVAKSDEWIDYLLMEIQAV